MLCKLSSSNTFVSWPTILYRTLRYQSLKRQVNWNARFVWVDDITHTVPFDCRIEMMQRSTSLHLHPREITKLLNPSSREAPQERASFTSKYLPLQLRLNYNLVGRSLSADLFLSRPVDFGGDDAVTVTSIAEMFAKAKLNPSGGIELKGIEGFAASLCRVFHMQVGGCPAWEASKGGNHCPILPSVPPLLGWKGWQASAALQSAHLSSSTSSWPRNSASHGKAPVLVLS